MTDFSTTEPTDSASEHFAKLKEYAQRVLVNGQKLSADETEDKETRLAALRELTDQYGFTEKDLVKLIFGRIFRDNEQCGCPTCRARRQMRNDKAGTGA
ncbi:MAG: hypothetical protein QF744_01370 [SAR202 cluster bacterium]|jgi:hypothetical protein|nr:hypothetical protein [SAR202 cluster bacterium]